MSMPLPVFIKFRLISVCIVVFGLLIPLTVDAQDFQMMKKFPKSYEIAILSGGCFWGMEEILRKIPGVLRTRVGYTGGILDNPRYEDVKTGKTGHTEAVEVRFDPAKISYEELLGYFFRMHDPTTFNRQGNDVGTQYRSVIYYQNEMQRKIAQMVKQRVDSSRRWPRPVVTEILPALKFYAAEEFHQKYLQKNPRGYTCHFLREP